tara:strand:+ start:70528 stop:71937 length:1410 start_codon:yes stop_codon:yes gene_type:complete
MYDVIVMGAGPAGATAALETSQAGLKTLLIDEQPDAGGQVWRAKSRAIISAPETEYSIAGDDLRASIRGSNVEVKYHTRVWQIEKNDDDHWLLGLQGEGQRQVSGKSLVIATGAQERVIPVPGWILPGVFGLAGATALFKEHMMVPGRRTIVSGNGPLLFYVASEILRLGGQVSAVVSLNSRFDWLKALPAMINNPKLIMQGIRWILALYKNSVPIYWQHTIKSVEGKTAVEGATITAVDREWRLLEHGERYIPSESICQGHGLIPAIEATRLAGAAHHFDEKLGGWVPTVDEFGRATVPGLYACGDNAGILGADAAPHRGRLAAKAILDDLDISATVNIDDKAYHSARKFGLAATRLTIPRAGFESFMTANTEVCRCEGISRAEIDHELKTGARSPNAVKSGTRCGMGPCGGRYCNESLTIITEHRTGKNRSEIGMATARPPLRPVHMDDLADDLDYDDLPIPGVSPL